MLLLSQTIRKGTVKIVPPRKALIHAHVAKRAGSVLDWNAAVPEGGCAALTAAIEVPFTIKLKGHFLQHMN
jgi:hypothetical protein